MARFSQQFLSGFTQPGLMQGALDLGTAIGSIPGQMKERRRLDAYRQMDPLERLDYDIANAKTREEIQKATAAKDAFTKQEALKAINKLEAARASTDDPRLQRNYERSMAGIAAKSGLDSRGYIGRTQAESDADMQRQLTQGRLEDRERTQREQALTNAYYRMSGDTLEQYEQNLIDSNFGYIVQDIKQDKAREDLVLLQLQNARTTADENAAMKREPLPKSALRTRIESANIDQALKDQFLSELEDIKEPDFDSKETWNPGERKVALSALESLNTAVRNEVSKQVTRKSSIRSDIRRLEKEFTTPPNFREIESFKAQAKKELDGFFIGADEEDIDRRAFELASLAKQAKIKELLDQRKLELGGEPAPIETQEPTEEKEETTELQDKADEIVGL